MLIPWLIWHHCWQLCLPPSSMQDQNEDQFFQSQIFHLHEFQYFSPYTCIDATVTYLILLFADDGVVRAIVSWERLVESDGNIAFLIFISCIT